MGDDSRQRRSGAIFATLGVGALGTVIALGPGGIDGASYWSSSPWMEVTAMEPEPLSGRYEVADTHRAEVLGQWNGQLADAGLRPAPWLIASPSSADDGEAVDASEPPLAAPVDLEDQAEPAPTDTMEADRAEEGDETEDLQAPDEDVEPSAVPEGLLESLSDEQVAHLARELGQEFAQGFVAGLSTALIPEEDGRPSEPAIEPLDPYIHAPGHEPQPLTPDQQFAQSVEAATVMAVALQQALIPLLFSPDLPHPPPPAVIAHPPVPPLRPVPPTASPLIPGAQPRGVAPGVLDPRRPTIARGTHVPQTPGIGSIVGLPGGGTTTFRGAPSTIPPPHAPWPSSMGMQPTMGIVPAPRGITPSPAGAFPAPGGMVFPPMGIVPPPMGVMPPMGPRPFTW